MTISSTHFLLIAIVLTSIVLMLIRPRQIAEVWWTGSGAILLIALKLISIPLAWQAVLQGSDVYLFLTGMMLLSELAREHKVFDWIAACTLRASRGSRLRLFTLVYAGGAVVTACLSNDATAVVLTPAILAATRKAKVDPLPFLFACALIANAASFALPISNPANLVVFHSGMPPLGRWLLMFALPSLLSVGATFMVLIIMFRRTLKGAVQPVSEKPRLEARGRLVLAGLAFVVLVLLIASALHTDLGLPTCLAAICITAIVSLKARISPVPLLREISWTTIVLVATLFVLVAGAQECGVLQIALHGLAWCQSLGAVRGSLIASFSIAALNNLVNNLPLGLITGATLSAAHTHGLYAGAALIGVDLGPNLSVTGSLATLLWLLALRRDRIQVTAFDFLKVGMVAMPCALVAAMLGLLTTYWLGF